MNLNFSTQNQNNTRYELLTISQLNIPRDLTVLILALEQYFSSNMNGVLILKFNELPITKDIEAFFIQIQKMAQDSQCKLGIVGIDFPNIDQLQYWLETNDAREKLAKLQQELSFRTELQNTISTLKNQNRELLEEIIKTESPTQPSHWKVSLSKWLGFKDPDL